MTMTQFLQAYRSLYGVHPTVTMSDIAYRTLLQTSHSPYYSRNKHFLNGTVCAICKSEIKCLFFMNCEHHEPFADFCFVLSSYFFFGCCFYINARDDTEGLFAQIINK